MGVSIYHLLSITIQQYIAWQSIADFCRWTQPFFQNHHVLYIPNSCRTVELAYNYSISHNIVHIICSVKVKTWIYHAQYSLYGDIQYINTTCFLSILYYWLNVSWYGDISIFCYISTGNITFSHNNNKSLIFKYGRMQKKTVSWLACGSHGD